MDVIDKSNGERQRVIGIYWDSVDTYIVSVSPTDSRMVVSPLKKNRIEIIDNVIDEKFIFVTISSDEPFLMNNIVYENNLWDDLIDSEPDAYDRLIELMPELLDVGKQHLYHCRVCGYRLDYFIWGRENDSPTYELCPCCGVQFGVMDETPFLAAQERRQWLDKGAPWLDESKKSADWSLEEQLKGIPEGFE